MFHARFAVSGPVPRMVCLIAVLALAACQGPDFAQAHEALSQVDSELKAAGHAQERNDAGAAQRHQAAAQKALMQAKTLFQQAEAARAKDPAVLREYASVLLRTGDTDLAAEALERATALQPGDAALWSSLGQVLGILGEARADDAVNALRKALALAPDSPQAPDIHVALGAVYTQAGLYDLASTSYDDALKCNPEHVGARLGKAAIKLRHGQVKACADDFDAVGALQPQYVVQLPRVLGEALDGFEQNRCSFDDTPENHMAYAKILVRANRLPLALAALERATTLAPEDYTAWNFIGSISSQLEKPEKARAAYERSLALNADQPRTRQALEALKGETPASPADSESSAGGESSPQS